MYCRFQALYHACEKGHFFPSIMILEPCFYVHFLYYSYMRIYSFAPFVNG